MEDEYIVMTESMKEVIWLQGLLDDLEIDLDLFKINRDSMSAIYLKKNQVYRARTSHIDVRFHFVWEILDEGDIELQKINTKENPLDMLTKVVPKWSLHITRSYSISFQLLALGELVWMNYGWLDLLGRGYIGSHIGAVRWSRHGAMLCSAQFENLHRGG